MRRSVAVLSAVVLSCAVASTYPSAAAAAPPAGTAPLAAADVDQFAAAGQSTLVSVRESGDRAEGASQTISLSGDGQHLLLTSTDSQLLDGEVIESPDPQLYLRDLSTGDNVLVSRGQDGGPVPGGFVEGDLSSDGGVVVFVTDAGLVPDDTNGLIDVYEFTAATGVSRLVSHRPNGRAANGESSNPSISADGRYIAYESDATDIDPDGPYWPGVTNIFRYDAAANLSTLVTKAYASGFASDADSRNPDISSDGNLIAFDSLSSQLVRNPGFDFQIYVYVARTDTIKLATRYANGTPFNGHNLYPEISGDGTHIVYSAKYPVNPDDPVLGGGYQNLYLLDLRTRAATLMTRAYNGGPASDPESFGTYYASISADGRRVAFTSPASNLVPGDTNNASDVFAYRAGTGKTVLLSRAVNGGPADGDSSSASISAAGTRVAYDSTATNLVVDDTNGASDAFLFGAP